MSRSRTALLTTLILFLMAEPIRLMSAQTENKPAVKFDEFGDILISELKARLDNYAVQLQNQPTARGFIIVYRTRRDLPGLNHSLSLSMKDYLVNSRGLPADRIVVVDGGVALCLTQELWVVPQGSAPPAKSDARIGFFQYSDSAWKFDEYGFGPLERDKRFGPSRIVDYDAEYLEAYANEVKGKRKYLACVIAYAQYNPRPGLVDYGDYEPVRDVMLDRPGTAQGRLALEKRYLTKVYGIPASKIRTIDGGYRKRRQVELWIVPADEPLPVPTPNSFPFGRRRK